MSAHGRQYRPAIDRIGITYTGAVAPIEFANAFLTIKIGFTSNVDMRSGAPAFGTPEYVKATLAGFTPH
jgi:trimethylamine:corrinoid methyltransferase-like protein